MYDFRNPLSGDPGFHWTDVDTNCMDWTPTQYQANLSHPLADSQASAEALNRKFAAVSKLAQQRMVDPERMDEDQLNFRNQTKYTTYFGYLFHLEWEDYEG